MAAIRSLVDFVQQNLANKALPSPEDLEEYLSGIQTSTTSPSERISQLSSSSSSSPTEALTPKQNIITSSHNLKSTLEDKDRAVLVNSFTEFFVLFNKLIDLLCKSSFHGWLAFASFLHFLLYHQLSSSALGGFGWFRRQLTFLRHSNDNLALEEILERMLARQFHFEFYYCLRVLLESCDWPEISFPSIRRRITLLSESCSFGTLGPMDFLDALYRFKSSCLTPLQHISKLKALLQLIPSNCHNLHADILLYMGPCKLSSKPKQDRLHQVFMAKGRWICSAVNSLDSLLLEKKEKIMRSTTHLSDPLDDLEKKEDKSLDNRNRLSLQAPALVELSPSQPQPSQPPLDQRRDQPSKPPAKQGPIAQQQSSRPATEQGPTVQQQQQQPQTQSLLSRSSAEQRPTAQQQSSRPATEQGPTAQQRSSRPAIEQRPAARQQPQTKSQLSRPPAEQRPTTQPQTQSQLSRPPAEQRPAAQQQRQQPQTLSQLSRPPAEQRPAAQQQTLSHTQIGERREASASSPFSSNRNMSPGGHKQSNDDAINLSGKRLRSEEEEQHNSSNEGKQHKRKRTSQEILEPVPAQHVIRREETIPDGEDVSVLWMDGTVVDRKEVEDKLAQALDKLKTCYSDEQRFHNCQADATALLEAFFDRSKTDNDILELCKKMNSKHVPPSCLEMRGKFRAFFPSRQFVVTPRFRTIVITESVTDPLPQRPMEESTTEEEEEDVSDDENRGNMDVSKGEESNDVMKNKEPFTPVSLQQGLSIPVRNDFSISTSPRDNQRPLSSPVDNSRPSQHSTTSSTSSDQVRLPSTDNTAASSNVAGKLQGAEASVVFGSSISNGALGISLAPAPLSWTTDHSHGTKDYLSRLSNESAQKERQSPAISVVSKSKTIDSSLGSSSSLSTSMKADQRSLPDQGLEPSSLLKTPIERLPSSSSSAAGVIDLTAETNQAAQTDRKAQSIPPSPQVSSRTTSQPLPSLEGDSRSIPTSSNTVSMRELLPTPEQYQELSYFFCCYIAAIPLLYFRYNEDLRAAVGRAVAAVLRVNSVGEIERQASAHNIMSETLERFISLARRYMSRAWKMHLKEHLLLAQAHQILMREPLSSFLPRSLYQPQNQSAAGNIMSPAEEHQTQPQVHQQSHSTGLVQNTAIGPRRIVEQFNGQVPVQNSNRPQQLPFTPSIANNPPRAAPIYYPPAYPIHQTPAWSSTGSSGNDFFYNRASMQTFSAHSQNNGAPLSSIQNAPPHNTSFLNIQPPGPRAYPLNPMLNQPQTNAPSSRSQETQPTNPQEAQWPMWR